MRIMGRLKGPSDKSRLYGPAIYQHKSQGKSWVQIAEVTGVPERTAQAYYATYQQTLKENPDLVRTVQAATDKMLELTKAAAERYTEFIGDRDPSPQISKIAFDASTNVLKSARALTDRQAVEHSVSSVPDKDLENDLNELLERRRREKISETSSGSEEEGT